MKKKTTIATSILVISTANDMDFVLISSWQEWSSDQTRERSDWQPHADWITADWTSLDDTRGRDFWQSPFKWHKDLIHEDIHKGIHAWW